MSKAKAKNKFMMALLRHSPNIRRMAQKKSKVTGLRLEVNRNRLEEKVILLDKIFADLDAEKDPEERQKLLLFFQVLSTYIIAVSNVHISDYLCVQWWDDEIKRKDKKTGKLEKVGGTIRISLGEMISFATDLLEGYDDEEDDESGLFGRLDLLGRIMNDIGKKQKAFVDETGMTDPDKHIPDKAPKIVAEAATEEDFEEDRGITDEERATEEKVGKVAVPDLRQKKEDDSGEDSTENS